MIMRRRVIYLHGYDPMGPDGYYGLFRSQLRKAAALWNVKADISPLTVESRDIATWSITSRGPNWKVHTQYDFVRWEDIINKYTSEPLARQAVRAICWLIGDLVTGTATRTFRASWRFGAHHLVLQLALLIWISISAAAGVFIWWALHGRGWLNAASLPIALAESIVVFLAMRPLAERWFVIRVNNHWPILREYGRGDATGFDRPIEVGAQRLTEAVASNDADEIVLVGHSGGAPLALSVVARALDLNPEFGRCGPRIVVMTIGSIMPCVGFHPSAYKMRKTVGRIAIERSVAWIDCQFRKDSLNFWDFDPVVGIGIDIGSRRHNPLVWPVRFRDMLAPDHYRSLRWRLFRLHFQCIMANDMRAPYDYFMLTCGPAPVEHWANCQRDAVAEFAADGSCRAPTIFLAEHEK
jgi:hypothetical protein